MSYCLYSTDNLLVFCYWCSVAQSCRTLCRPQGLESTRLLSLGFSRQDYWSGLFFLPPRDLPDPEIKPASPCLLHGFFTAEPLEKPPPFHTESQQIAALFVLEGFLSDLAICVLHRKVKSLEAHMFPWALV